MKCRGSFIKDRDTLRKDMLLVNKWMCNTLLRLTSITIGASIWYTRPAELVAIYVHDFPIDIE